MENILPDFCIVKTDFLQNEKPEITSENTVEKIWSVSLIPYHPKFGYMIGEEYRRKEREMKFHMIGGKSESWDKDPIETAIREFIEETNIIGFSFFQQFAEESFLKWIQQNGITLETKYPHFTTFLQPFFEDSIRNHSKYFDEQVSPHKWVEDHYEIKIHRFYIWDISKFKYHREMIEFPFHYNQLHPYMRLNDKMWSLYWIFPHQFGYLPHKSALFVKWMKQLENDKKK